MRVCILILTLTLTLAVFAQEKKKEERKFDPFANPVEEMAKRAEEAAKEKKYNELKDAAAALAELSKKMSDEITAGGKDVISAKIFVNLDRAEKLVKTMRDKAK
jgi:hypothetical protein